MRKLTKDDLRAANAQQRQLVPDKNQILIELKSIKEQIAALEIQQKNLEEILRELEPAKP